jgi:hypothetical protein
MERGQARRQGANVGRRIRQTGQHVHPDPDQDAMPGAGFETFRQDPTEFPTVGLDVIGPPDPEGRSPELKLAQGFDHSDGRGQRELRLAFDRQAVRRWVDRQSECQAACVGPPPIGSSPSASGLNASPGHQRKLDAPLANQFGRAVTRGIEDFVLHERTYERPVVWLIFG